MRRSAAPRRLVVGGRNLGGPGAPVVRFALRLGDRVVDTWDVAPNPGFFVRSITIAGSAVAPGGSELEAFVVTAAAGDGSVGQVPTAIEQFGLQPLDAVQFAFAEGWHEDEFQPRTGLRWRWSSGESWLQVWPVDRDIRIRLAAESPLKTFDEAPIVKLTAGARELARATPGDAFAIDAIVPADVLRAANGRIVLRSSRTFVPADNVSAGDPREAIAGRSASASSRPPSPTRPGSRRNSAPAVRLNRVGACIVFRGRTTRRIAAPHGPSPGSSSMSQSRARLLTISLCPGHGAGGVRQEAAPAPADAAAAPAAEATAAAPAAAAGSDAGAGAARADRGRDLRAHVARGAEREEAARRRVLRARQLRPRRRGAGVAAEERRVHEAVDRRCRISVEGHCDERGTAEYNLALGERRATR